MNFVSQSLEILETNQTNDDGSNHHQTDNRSNYYQTN